MKKLLCFMLAMLMVISCFVACSKEDEDDDYAAPAPTPPVTDNNTANSSSVASGAPDIEDFSDIVDSSLVDASTESSYIPDPPSSEDSAIYQSMLGAPVDMGGREFYILQRWFGYGNDTMEFYGEVIWDPALEEQGIMNNINLAKKKAKDAVEKNYNCVITGKISKDSAGIIREEIRTDLESGTYAIDFCFESYYYYPSLLVNENLVDLKTLGIDFTKPWWNQNAVTDMSVANKLYYACGDINTYDNDGTMVMLFNKSLYKANGGDPAELYAMAKDGTWTFDALASKVKGFGKDSNGDGTRDEFDTYGLLTETSNLYYHIIAAGEKTVSKNAEDLPEFTFGNQRVYDAYNDAVALYKSSNDVLVADLEKYTNKYDYSNVYTNTVINAFKEGRGLFYMTSLIHIPYFRDMYDDFGVLPIPKYDTVQPRYYHTMGAHTTSCVFVPNGTRAYGEKGQQLGMILDALGAYSKDYVTPVYYERQLKRGDASDEDSKDMLDLIFSSTTYDLGAVFGTEWGDPISMCNTLTGNLQATIDAKSMIIELSIADTIYRLTDGY